MVSCYAVLDFAQFSMTLLHKFLRDLLIKARRVGALLAGVSKQSTPVQLSFF